jgi:hypothetical protein
VVQIIVHFSGAVNAGEAGDVATYRLATAGKKGSICRLEIRVTRRSRIWPTDS